ncbi:MAG: hypothetical protein Q8K92_13600, partial [Leadbetterella sp.]|nr:hypothetical protein [Leadbetterella sp.]
HLEKIFKAYQNYKSEENFAALVETSVVLENNANMAISLYIRPEQYNAANNETFETVFDQWETSGLALKSSMNDLFKILEN